MFVKVLWPQPLDAFKSVEQDLWPEKKQLAIVSTSFYYQQIDDKNYATSDDKEYNVNVIF
jgi:hypothetical protein